MTAARRQISPVERHAGLVRWVVNRYARHVSAKGGLDRDDLVQAGFMGLMRGLETYNPDLGAPSTYLSHWIRHEVQREIANRSEVVRVPVHVQDARSKAGERRRTRSFSLDRHVGDEDGGTFIDLIPAPEPENDTSDLPDISLEALIAATPELSEREATVLRERAKDRTLKEVGGDFGVGRERARQIERDAIEKVRAARGITVEGLDPSRQVERARERERALCRQAARQERRQLVIVLRAQGLPWRAIGERLGCSQGAAYRLFERARAAQQKARRKAQQKAAA